MSQTTQVFGGGSKGGVGKSTNARLACLGAILSNQGDAYVLTDPDRELLKKGRPYEVLDGRKPKELASIMNATRKASEGWLIIDGGGNRPAFDAEIAKEVDLCILPFRPSHEDMDTVSKDLERIGNAIAWPTAWPTNIFAIPRPGERICDPAAGTCGFLVNAWQHLLETHTDPRDLTYDEEGYPHGLSGTKLAKEEWEFSQTKALTGFDSDPRLQL